MSRGKPIAVQQLLDKSKDCAMQAITAYNDPRSTFRTGTFTVMMIIAWTSLFHAHFEKRKVKYFYRKAGKAVRYEMIDGDYKAWELDECVKEYYKSDTENPVRKNLELFVRLRNKIEHRKLAALDSELQGECQAMIQNYEKMLKDSFGENELLGQQFFVPIQFSANVSSVPKTLKDKDIIKFINEYRNSLTPEVRSSQDYQFKVFLVPNVGNHRSSSDLAVQFVKFDPNNPEEMEKYEKGIVFIKDKKVSIINDSMIKPGKVLCKVKERSGTTKNLHWHTRKWKEHNVRPDSKALDKVTTNTKYCLYDSAHNDYLYTSEWIDLLCEDIEKERSEA